MRSKLHLVCFSILLFIGTSGCSVLSELSAFSKCEFRLHSAEEPLLCGINVSQKRSWSDFSFQEGSLIAARILSGTLPFDIVANVEVRNPGSTMAAVNSIQWRLFVDDVEAAQGTVRDRVEIAPMGGRSLVPVHVHVDLMEYLEGDNPKAITNFALNLMNMGTESSELRLKIKPSVLIASQEVQYPGYFTVTHEFSTGN